MFFCGTYIYWGLVSNDLIDKLIRKEFRSRIRCFLISKENGLDNKMRKRLKARCKTRRFLVRSVLGRRECSAIFPGSWGREGTLRET